MHLHALTTLLHALNAHVLACTHHTLSLARTDTVWGRVSDVHGSQRALQLAMAGDTLFFALSAVAPFGLHRTWSPVAGCAILVGVRACVGFFTPLVSAVLFIFDRAASPKDIVKGLSYYSNASR